MLNKIGEAVYIVYQEPAPAVTPDVRGIFAERQEAEQFVAVSNAQAGAAYRSNAYDGPYFLVPTLLR